MDNYEQKYKNALSWMQSLYKGLHGKTKEEAETYFPELKESEDERVRKRLLKIFREAQPTDNWGGLSTKDILAWLEKQGEIIKEWSEMKMNNIQTELQEMVDLKQKTEQGEQKSADKVEPKFYEGDWVCENEPNNYARFIQILEIVNVHGKERYRISRDIHNDEDIVEFNFVEKYYHKFDIKDAKGGDVLVDTYGNIGIFEKTFGNDWYSYCYLGCNGDFMYNDVGGSHDLINTYPATKEQRDTLLKAMADAGYTFDFDKKELKKIKQNPADVSKQEPIDTTDLTDFEKCFKGMCCDKNQKFVKECCVSLLELARKQIQGEQKQEWSEEDRETIDYLIDYLESELDSSYTKEDKEEFTKEIELLKSLRPQNTWKPSDEQMWALSTLVNIPESASDTCKKTAQELLEQLKKLREE